MVDRVELASRGAASTYDGFSTVMTVSVVAERREPGHEVVEVRYVCHHVVGDDQARVTVLGDEARGRSRRRRTRRSSARRPPARSSPRSGRLDAQHPDAERLELLEEVAVVAGDLDDQVSRPQVEASRIERA